MTEIFVEKARRLYGVIANDLYDYSKVVYTDTRTKVDIFCNFHGVKFSQSPYQHYKGFGCNMCQKQHKNGFLWDSRNNSKHNSSKFIQTNHVKKQDNISRLKKILDANMDYKQFIKSVSVEDFNLMKIHHDKLFTYTQDDEIIDGITELVEKSSKVINKPESSNKVIEVIVNESSDKSSNKPVSSEIITTKVEVIEVLEKPKKTKKVKANEVLNYEDNDEHSARCAVVSLLERSGDNVFDINKYTNEKSVIDITCIHCGKVLYESAIIGSYKKRAHLVSCACNKKYNYEDESEFDDIIYQPITSENLLQVRNAIISQINKHEKNYLEYLKLSKKINSLDFELINTLVVDSNWLSKKPKKWLSDAMEAHNNTYLYIMVNDITTSTGKLHVWCRKSGHVVVANNNHTAGKRCIGCKNITADETIFLETKKSPLDRFIEKAQIKHDNYYSYKKSIYVKDNVGTIIICPEHGEFKQAPCDHLRGSGCPECTTYKHTTEECIEAARKVHGGLYDYSKFVYTTREVKSIIICKKHGEFSQTAFMHINNKNGCPTCAGHVSEKQLKWLESLNIDGLQFGNKEFKIGIYRVDGYDEKTKTVYEFNGCYWHGCIKCSKGEKNNYFNVNTGKTFGELYEKSQEKKKYIIGQGYNYVEKWECEL